MQPLPTSLQPTPIFLLPTTTSQTTVVDVWPLSTRDLPRPIVSERKLPSPTVLPPWEYIERGTTSTIKTFEQTRQQIENLYIVKDAQAVRRFIRLHPFLAALLVEAYGQLSEFFGPNPQASLSVACDPEQEELAELLVSVMTPLEPDEALRQLDAFDDYWFLNQLDLVKGSLNFNLEFV